MDMNLGGPVWHASVAGSLIKAVLWQEAERQLAGAGDASLGEWREPGDVAVHLRRRLSEREQRAVGPLTAPESAPVHGCPGLRITRPGG
jgi:hypothetical protein